MIKNYVLVVAAAIFFLEGCSSDSAGLYTVGGTLSSMNVGETVVLQNNSGNDLSLDEDGSFTFSTSIIDGGDYSVTVLTQPSRKACTVSNGSGSITGSNITNITVSCATTAPIIFASASSPNGNLGTIAAADAICMADANKPATGTYKALLVDGSTRRACSSANCTVASGNNIDWVLEPDTAYYRSNQTTEIVTTNAAGVFVFGALTNSIDGTTGWYWTGLADNWTANNTCSGWTTASGVVSGSGGRGDQTNGFSIGFFSNVCSGTIPLLCAEQL